MFCREEKEKKNWFYSKELSADTAIDLNRERSNTERVERLVKKTGKRCPIDKNTIME